MIPSAYLRIAEALAALALVLGLCWGAHEFLQHEQQIGYDRRVAEDKVAEAAAKDAALKTERSMQSKVDEAQNARIQQAQVNQVAADAASAAADRLRVAASDLTRRVSADPGKAGADAAATLAQLLGECSDRYRDLARRADGHAADAKTLNDAWPDPRLSPDPGDNSPR